MAMAILLSFQERVGQASSYREGVPSPPPQLSIEEGRKLAMAILLSLFGLEGQTCSSLAGR